MVATANNKKTNPQSLVTRAYDEIKRRILSNEMPPGFHALEQEVAAQLGVSRTPVREALIRLKNEGLVDLIPRRGMRVIPLLPDDMREIYEVLTAVEVMAAELLARKTPSPDDLQPMTTAVDDMEQALEADDLEAWASADERFHQSLLDLCGNSRLSTLAMTVRDQGRRARNVTLRLRPKPDKSNDDHRALVDAILNGDWKLARKVHYAHRTVTGKVLTDLLDNFPVPQL